MDILGVVFILALALIYLMFLIPAFMFVWEWELGGYNGGLGCTGFVCMVVGFPGALFAVICRLIKWWYENRLEKKRREENEIEEAIQRENRMRIEEEQRRKLQEYTAQRVDHYMNSAKVDEIVRALAQRGPLYRVVISRSEITVHHEGGQFLYKLLDHGVASFTVPDGPFKARTSDMYMFALAVNRKLGGAFTVAEDGYNTDSFGFRYTVILTRPLQTL